MSQERALLLQLLGKNVRTERRKANMSMEKLAELSNVSLQTIKDIEHAKRACQVDTLVAIASALHLSPDYLLGFLILMAKILKMKQTLMFSTTH